MSTTPRFALATVALYLLAASLPACKSATRSQPSAPVAARPESPGAPPGGPGARPPRRRGPRGGVLRVLDADRDGVISAAEIANAPAALRKLDRNQDGKLTWDEVGPRRRRRGRRWRRRRGPRPRGRSHARNAAEKRILKTLAELEGHRLGMANVSRADGRLLRTLVELVDARHVVEIGTSNGYSGTWISLGLLATGGRLTTYDIDPHKVKLARKHFRQAGVEKRVTTVLGNAHQEVKKLKGPIDMLFIDADKPGYLDYLQKLLPLVRPGGVIAAHNMVHPPPDPRFIRAITTDPRLETVFLLMDGAGLGVSVKRR